MRLLKRLRPSLAGKRPQTAKSLAALTSVGASLLAIRLLKRLHPSLAGKLPQTAKSLVPLTSVGASLLAMRLWAMAVLLAGLGVAHAQGLAPVSISTDSAAPDTPQQHTPTESAQTKSTNTEAAHRWRYTLGLKIKSGDETDGSKSVALRPVLGLRYGRWRLGYATGDEWLKFSGYRKETNVAYELRDNEKLNIALSARVQNLKDNSSFDGFASGKNTVRARVSVGYQLNSRWAIGSDVTQDLMNRGDGTTVSLGLSHLWPLSDHSSLSLSGGTTWASGQHWATQWRVQPAPPEGWHAGLGELGLGMSYRYAITSQWAWFGTLGTSRHLGQVNDVSPSQLSWNSQIGLLYFSR